MPVLAPAIPFPPVPYIPTSLRYNPLYILLQRLTAGDQIVYFDQNNLQSYRGTVTSIDRTQLVVNCPGHTPATITLPINPQDYEASLSVMSLR